MLETPTAIANAKEIAAVPGVDVLLIRTNDRCAEMRLCGQHRGDGLIAGLTIIVVERLVDCGPGRRRLGRRAGDSEQKIYESLNVNDQWNGANDFVFFDRRGEFASNRRRS
jgi:hypothetical protein